MTEASSAPFARVRVLELTRGIAGRTAGMLLADIDADVVRGADDKPGDRSIPGAVLGPEPAEPGLDDLAAGVSRQRDGAVGAPDRSG